MDRSFLLGRTRRDYPTGEDGRIAADPQTRRAAWAKPKRNRFNEVESLVVPSENGFFSLTFVEGTERFARRSQRKAMRHEFLDRDLLVDDDAADLGPLAD